VLRRHRLRDVLPLQGERDTPVRHSEARPGVQDLQRRGGGGLIFFLMICVLFLRPVVSL